jgi:hypothetical protein
MILNKNKGSWIDYELNEKFWIEHKPTLIDDYAYQLYLNNINPLISDIYKVNQQTVMYAHITENKFKMYYILAENMLRKEKLEKICSKSETK